MPEMFRCMAPRVPRCALLLALALVACESVQTTRSGEVGVARKQTMSVLVSPQQVDQAAQQQYVELTRAADAKGELNRDPLQAERVRTIVRRVIPHTRVFRDDAPGWAWEVNVISAPAINAWCMPGGRSLSTRASSRSCKSPMTNWPRSSGMKLRTHCASTRASA